MTITLGCVVVLAVALAAALWLAWQRTNDARRAKVILASMQDTIALRTAELGKVLDKSSAVPAN